MTLIEEVFLLFWCFLAA